MAEYSYKLYAYVYDNALTTYSWTELMDDNSKSRLVGFDDISVSVEDPLNLANAFADAGVIRVWDHDNYWGSPTDETNGIVNSSDPVWKDYKYRPLKLMLCDGAGTEVKSMVVCIDDIVPTEGSPVAEIQTIGLARRAMDVPADGKTCAGNTLYGAWTGSTSPTLYASRTETAADNTLIKGWFTNRRAVDIVKKTCYALEEDRLGTPSISNPTVTRTDGIRFVSNRSALSSGADGVGISDTIFHGCSDGTDLYFVAGNKLYFYDVSEDTYTLKYTDASSTADLVRVWYNTNGKLYIIKVDDPATPPATITLIQYTISTAATTTRTLTGCMYSYAGYHNYGFHYGVEATFVQSWETTGALFYIQDDGDSTYTYHVYTCSDIGNTWTDKAHGDLPLDANSEMVEPSTPIRVDQTNGVIWMQMFGSWQAGAPENDYATLYRLTYTGTPAEITFYKRWDAYQESGERTQQIADIGWTSTYVVCSILYDSGVTATESRLAYKANNADGAWAGELDVWAYANTADGDNGYMPRIGMQVAPDGSIYYVRNRQNIMARAYEDGGNMYIQELNLLESANSAGIPMFNNGDYGIWEGTRQAGSGCDLILDRGTSTTFKIYGVSQPSGILFQYAKDYAGFIDLCKWDGKSIADVRDICAKMLRAKWYYSQAGVFQFKELPVATGSSVKDYAEGEYLSITRETNGRDAVINHYIYVPYRIAKKDAYISGFAINNIYNSSFIIREPTITKACAANCYWRLTVTSVSGTTATYRLDYLDSGTWTEQATGLSSADTVVQSYLIITPDCFAGTPYTGDSAYWWAQPAEYDFEQMTSFDALEVEDSTSIGKYNTIDSRVDEPFLHRLLAEETLTRWLNRTKDPKAVYNLRVPYEGLESTLVPDAEITVTNAKHSLTSATHFRIIGLSWSQGSARIACNLKIKQI